MKVLCLLDVDDYTNKNAYPIDFVNSLKLNKHIEQLDFGIANLLLNTPKWDIIHIHWPDDLMKGKILTRRTLTALDQKLKSWRKYARIVCTVHDHESYYRKSKLTTLLYNTVFNNCDGFIHMGQASVDIFNYTFKNQFASKPFSIIPHGNYISIGSIYGKAKAREKLKIKQDTKVILVIGKLRHNEEFDLMLNSFKCIAKENYHLIFLGNFYTTRSFLKDLNLKMLVISVFEKLYWRIALLTTPNITAKIGLNHSDTMLDYLSASDILFIPRKKILNSGNVPLGFTFSKIVMGPNWGNVGELLNLYNNPTFEINDSIEVIGKKLNNALKLVNTTLEEENRIVAYKEWDWDNVSQLYVDFYEKIINLKPAH
jgi:beta-1,4-mannosyltransferase